MGCVLSSTSLLIVRGEVCCGNGVGRFACVLDMCTGCSTIAVVKAGHVGVGSVGGVDHGGVGRNGVGAW